MKLSVYIITIIFLLQSAAGAVPIFVENVPAIGKDIFIPESYGIIEKSSFDDYLSSRFVVLVKDAHCNYDAQHNIARILEVLVRDYKIDLVAVEGAAGALDFTRYWKLENEPAREKMADTFVKKGILTGPEYLTITKDGKLSFNIYGIEDEKLYVENFTTFRQTIDHVEETELFINEVARIIKHLKQKIYPKELLGFDNKAVQYYGNTISLTDWVKELNKEAERLGLVLKEYPNISLTLDSIALEEQVDFKKVEIERAGAIGSLEKTLSKEDLRKMVEESLKFRLGKISSSDYYKYLEELLKAGEACNFPNLMKYIELVKFQSWINNDALFSEIDDLEERIKETMFQDNIQRELNGLSKRVRILNNLFKLTLNREDLEYYMGHKSEFLPSSILSFLNIQAPLHDIPMSMLLSNQVFLNTVTGVISSGERFYYIAVERDVSLVENTLRVMEEKKKASAIMVIGGFHTDGVINLFETKGIGYVVVSPKIVRAEREGLYVSLMMDNRIQVAQKTSPLALPKLMADGEDNVARIVIPMGAEGWRKDLLDRAMRVYLGFLGGEVVEEKAEIPFIVSIKPDGTLVVDRNPEYKDTETPDMILEWFRLGLSEVLGKSRDLRDFVTEPGVAEKYLGRPAVLEYRLRVGHTINEGILRRATIGFLEFYLDLCRLYEKGGWLAVQQSLGARSVPESIRAKEFDTGYRQAQLKGELRESLRNRGIDSDVVEGIINYLFTMPAYGIDEKGNFYQTLFFSSILSLADDVFGVQKDDKLRGLFERLRSYRFLQVYLAKLYGVDKPEPIRDEDSIDLILKRKEERAKRVELLARYLSGEKFPEYEERLAGIASSKLPEWQTRQWVKTAGGVTVLNEEGVGDPLKRQVYVTTLSRQGMTDALTASDRYREGKERFEAGLEPVDAVLAGLKEGTTFVHDISSHLGEVREVELGKYEYSDLGYPAVGFLREVQRSKDKAQLFLYETDAQKEAMRAKLLRDGIKVEDGQFMHISDYNRIVTGLIGEGKVVVTMLSDDLNRRLDTITGNRVLVGDETGSDLMFMSRLALIVAAPVIEVDAVRGTIRDLLTRYFSGTEEDIERYLTPEYITIDLERGIFRILLPPITPFVRAFYDMLLRSREITSKAA